MKQRTLTRLLDASLAIQRLQRYVNGKTFFDFEADDYFRSAVERQFEILSEALNVAATFDVSIEQRIPELRTIVGLRNQIAHEYDEIDDQILWDTVTQDIDRLSVQIAGVLAERDPPGDALP